MRKPAVQLDIQRKDSKRAVLLEKSYSDSIVIYLDVLGFRDKVLKSISDKELIYQIYEYLTTISSASQKKRRLRQAYGESWESIVRNIKVNIFSDNILISYSGFSFSALKYILHVICRYMFTTFDYGWFLRGAIVFGPSYQDKNIVFGPAMNKAYEMESRHADWPRIILDSSIIRKLRGFQLTFFDNWLFARDNDGFIFLDYLRYLFVQNLAEEDGEKPVEPWGLPASHVFKSHREAIYHSINSVGENEGLLSKFHSLTIYHNNSIDRLIKELNDPRSLIKLSTSIKNYYAPILRKEKIDLRSFFYELY